MKNWYVGQKVVCVGDFVDKFNDTYDTIYPKIGQILTIREIEAVNEKVGLIFEEILNTKEIWFDGFFESSFLDSRFRPLDESRLDQFRVHLNPKKVEEKVDA